MNDDIRKRVEAARTELQSIIDRRQAGTPFTAFRMRIPARETDSDVVIGNGLNALDALLTENARLQAELAQANAEREALREALQANDDAYSAWLEGEKRAEEYLEFVRETARKALAAHQHAASDGADAEGAHE